METIEDVMKHLESKGCNKEEIEKMLAVIEQEQGCSLNLFDVLNTHLPNIVDKNTIITIFTETNNKKKILAEIDKEKSLELENLKTQNLRDARKYLKQKYWQDIAMVSVIMVFIFVLSYTQGLEKQSVGTLIGAIIGYALSRLKGKPSES